MKEVYSGVIPLLISTALIRTEKLRCSIIFLLIIMKLKKIV